MKSRSTIPAGPCPPSDDPDVPPFRPGDRVRELAGGPVMVVREVTYEPVDSPPFGSFVTELLRRLLGRLLVPHYWYVACVGHGMQSWSASLLERADGVLAGRGVR